MLHGPSLQISFVLSFHRRSSSIGPLKWAETSSSSWPVPSTPTGKGTSSSWATMPHSWPTTTLTTAPRTAASTGCKLTFDSVTRCWNKRSKSCPKSIHSNFTLKVMAFKVAQKVYKYFAYLCLPFVTMNFQKSPNLDALPVEHFNYNHRQT